nr:[protein-PII] uridylyltransferase [Sphingomonas jejuensis]
MSRFESLPNRRAIIDRKAVADALAAIPDGTSGAMRTAMVAIIRRALDDGRAEIARRLDEAPARGLPAANAGAFLVDQLLRLLFDFTTTRLYPLANPTAAERLVLVAVGGYGRGELAPHSDVDIGFVTPWKRSGWAEQVIETILYTLWDLQLRIGYSSRSVDDTLRLARQDGTIRTALLESRFVWGDAPLWEEVSGRLAREVMSGNARAFVADKLEERDRRHVRMGDSRYVVEPNVKEGKGGLRDLHTLFWIGKYVHQVGRVTDLVEAGLLTPVELRRFQKAEDFLWAVRCHLHLAAGRHEERLTFDMQAEIARRMRYAERPGRAPVERFMQHYFLNARTVGDLTGLFLAHLDEAMAARGRRFVLPQLGRRPRRLDGFTIVRGRLAIPEDDFFRADPVRLLQLFALADRHGLEIHPLTMRAAGRDAVLITGTIRRDPRANALFMDVLTSPRDPETVLRWMNEAGVFGRFVPDFGRVVAKMQFDMYHHYTVDEHTIRAVGLLARILKGDLAGDHPLATEIGHGLVSRRILPVAVLLHDIAKGRAGDHSVLGEEVAKRLCPRLGLTAAETETVAWLVRWHLLMSATAFKRDLSDYKTILDFADRVQSAERLRMLLLLTVVDIRAVGPGVWNGWKRQLLTELYLSAEERLRLGHKHVGREERVAAKQAALATALGWAPDRFERHRARLPESYWIAEPADVLERNARLVDGASDAPVVTEAHADSERGATLVTVYAADHPGLFYRIAGAIHLAGANVIDARIHTTRDGMALDNFLVQDPVGGTFADAAQLDRLCRTIKETLASRARPDERLVTRPAPRVRADAFQVQPAVLIDNKASNRYTVVEVNARDRAALLSGLAHGLFQSRVTLHSAHVATYGERAVDTFYVTDLIGQKITAPARMKALEKRLLEAASGKVDRREAA